MANNKLFGIKSAYLLLLVLLVSVVCLPAAVSADLGEPNIHYSILPSTGTVTVTLSEQGGHDYAQNVYVTLSTTTPGVSFGDSQFISRLNQGETKTLTFPIMADVRTKSGQYEGTIRITYEETGALGIGKYGHTISDTFTYNVVPVVTSIASVLATGKSPLSPITIIIACIVTAFVAVYTGSRRERK